MTIDSFRLPPLKTLLGEQGRNRRYRCPVHGGEGFNVSVHNGKDGRERAHCHSRCGDLGDAIGLTMTLERCDFPTALRRLGIEAGVSNARDERRQPTAKPSPPAKPSPLVSPTPLASPTPAWNDALERIVSDGEAGLWGPRGTEALAYLRKRRLNDDMIKRFRLGFLPGSGWMDGIVGKDGKPKKYPLGMIVLPWFDWEGRPYAIKFRAPSDDVEKKGRWRGLGSCDGLYPSPNLLTPGTPVFLVEGLMDALSVIQEAQGFAVAVSPGSATASLGSEQDALRFAPAVFVMGDADEAGEKAASAWLAAIDHAQRVTIPGGFKDANDALRGEFPAPWRSLKAWLEDVAGVGDASGVEDASGEGFASEPLKDALERDVTRCEGVDDQNHLEADPCRCEDSTGVVEHSRACGVARIDDLEARLVKTFGSTVDAANWLPVWVETNDEDAVVNHVAAFLEAVPNDPEVKRNVGILNVWVPDLHRHEGWFDVLLDSYAKCSRLDWLNRPGAAWYLAIYDVFDWIKAQEADECDAKPSLPGSQPGTPSKTRPTTPGSVAQPCGDGARPIPSSTKPSKRRWIP